MPPNTGYDITLKCEHVLVMKVPPRMGEQIWCVRCDSYRRVVGGVPSEYRVRCQNCRFSRLGTSGRIYAEAKAIKHAIGKRHRVALMDGLKVVRLYDHNGDGQMSLEDVPPF